MSKDFTPKELFYADKQFSFREQELTFFDMTTGEEFPLKDKLYGLLKKIYPETMFLCESSENLYKEFINDKARNNVFQLLENAIVKAENNAEPKTEFEKTVNLWFNGELDKSFYYREENDRQLFKILDKEYLNELNKNKNVNISDKNIER